MTWVLLAAVAPQGCWRGTAVAFPYRMDFRGPAPNSRFPRPEAAPPTEPRRVVQCGVCGRAEGVSADQLLGHLEGEWPRCCGEPMLYLVERGGAE